jgi:hypothetical protein
MDLARIEVPITSATDPLRCRLPLIHPVLLSIDPSWHVLSLSHVQGSVQRPYTPPFPRSSLDAVCYPIIRYFPSPFEKIKNVLINVIGLSRLGTFTES